MDDGAGVDVQWPNGEHGGRGYLSLNTGALIRPEEEGPTDAMDTDFFAHDDTAAIGAAFVSTESELRAPPAPIDKSWKFIRNSDTPSLPADAAVPRPARNRRPPSKPDIGYVPPRPERTDGPSAKRAPAGTTRPGPLGKQHKAHSGHPYSVHEHLPQLPSLLPPLSSLAPGESSQRISNPVEMSQAPDVTETTFPMAHPTEVMPAPTPPSVASAEVPPLPTVAAADGPPAPWEATLLNDAPPVGWSFEADEIGGATTALPPPPAPGLPHPPPSPPAAVTPSLLTVTSAPSPGVPGTTSVGLAKAALAARAAGSTATHAAAAATAAAKAQAAAAAGGINSADTGAPIDGAPGGAFHGAAAASATATAAAAAAVAPRRHSNMPRGRPPAQHAHCVGIALPSIKAVFHLTVADAAKQLGIGVTLLKKRCRELGIARWPGRKITSLHQLLVDVDSQKLPERRLVGALANAGLLPPGGATSGPEWAPTAPAGGSDDDAVGDEAPKPVVPVAGDMDRGEVGKAALIPSAARWIEAALVGRDRPRMTPGEALAASGLAPTLIASGAAAPIEDGVDVDAPAPNPPVMSAAARKAAHYGNGLQRAKEVLESELMRIQASPSSASVDLKPRLKKLRQAIYKARFMQRKMAAAPRRAYHPKDSAGAKAAASVAKANAAAKREAAAAAAIAAAVAEGASGGESDGGGDGDGPRRLATDPGGGDHGMLGSSTAAGTTTGLGERLGKGMRREAAAKRAAAALVAQAEAAAAAQADAAADAAAMWPTATWLSTGGGGGGGGGPRGGGGGPKRKRVQETYLGCCSRAGQDFLGGRTTDWIQCGICYSWGHLECYGLGDLGRLDTEDWACPNCAADDGEGDEPLDANLMRLAALAGD